MTDSEKREASRLFYQKWAGKGKEDEDDRSYWLDILQRIMGVIDATDRIEFQKKVIVDGNTKRIDAYIPETKIIIEQKSLGIALDKKIHQSGGIDLTPYEQAKRYNDNLPLSEKARWIVTSNFSDIWIYNMESRIPENEITKITIADLQSQYSLLDFLLSQKVKILTEEMELSLKAGELVGKIHDRFLEQYNDPMAKKTQNSLNILCVRLVFCLYAEDAGLFGEKDAFSKYISQYEPKDIRRALLDLFKVLDTPYDQRGDLYLDEELESFPYCNGGLFARENIEIPKITQEIKDTILESSHFNWRKISPTIFGAVFESTLNPETRRSGGMHYTSIENIHKVIDPLFLDDLKAEFADILAIKVPKTRDNKLRAFQDKLAGLKFLDPACGSGNFLTETYVSLRRLENEILQELEHGQITIGFGSMSPIKIGIDQFYGIEINDFAVTVAKTALWIAESQMMKETEDVCHLDLNFLPLKTNANIIEDNALRIDWNRVVPRTELSYIMGNPPFVGARLMSAEQKEDLDLIFEKQKGIGNLDYVTAWYKKASSYIKNTKIEIALVSTNSITQGEQVGLLWEKLITEGICINFAYRTFRWDSEANIKAHVHCVIIGFSYIAKQEKTLFNEKGEASKVKNINAYLVDAPNVFISNRKSPIQNVPEMVFGSMPNDGGYLSDYDNDSKNQIVKAYPQAEVLFKQFVGATEFLHNKLRWCLWLKEADISIIKSVAPVMEAIGNVQNLRSSSNRESTKKLADTPMLFGEIRQPDKPYLLIPRHTSESRRYIPFGYMSPEIICGDANMLIPNATIYVFGIMTSNVHMAWMRTVCGRIKSDYRYSATVVYNNFPWPDPTEEQKAKIEETAQGILDARALKPDCSLSDLYDPRIMPDELRKAHRANDKAVMQAYGLDVKATSEEDCVAFLMKKYQELTSKEKK
ncbi:MAG: methylase [Eubacteriales bacterium]|nr:methylase [Eubacteriales bacterium]